MSQLEYLEEERKKLWEQLNVLKQEHAQCIPLLEEKLIEIEALVNSKITVSEADAKQASKKTSEYRNRAQEASEAALKISEELTKKSGELIKNITEIDILYKEAINKKEAATAAYDEIIEFEKTISDADEEWENNIEELTKNLETSKTNFAKAENSAQQIQKIETSCNSLLSKITALHSKAAESNQEMQNLYDDIFGYEFEDEKTNETKNIEGLKSKLEKTYISLETSLSNFSKELIDFKEAKKSEYIELIQSKEKEYAALKKKIEELLPDALTAGLSHAYQKKRETEEVERETANKSFKTYIGFLTLSAFIPFFVSLYLAYGGQSILEIISYVPKVVMAILPIYIPLIWLAVVANKKINLSKRLIEEYSHKEALSKTFEGLSKQIATLPDDESSAELRIKLLYNLINATAENPGTLILNYNKSDNPVFDVIEKSASLGQALDKFHAYPGIGKFIDKINKSQEHAKQKTISNITTGIEFATQETEK